MPAPDQVDMVAPGVAPAESDSSSYYFPISPWMLFVNTKGHFGVYLRKDDRFVLYAHPNEPFTQEQRQRLVEHGVEEVFVLTSQRRQFEGYLEKNLGNILKNEGLPIRERSRVFYDASLSIVRDTFSQRLPADPGQPRFSRVQNLVNQTVSFLLKAESLKNVASFISHDFKTYSHCVNVFVYNTAVLQTYELEEKFQVQCGLGALLHDLGKTQIPKKILNKPGRLTPSERIAIEAHPIQGVAMCALAPLSQEAINSILFHHEKADGSGYPSGLKSPEIPLPVKVLTVADIYDALTSNRPYAKQYSPFEALTLMREEMAGHFDQEIFRRLVMVLSGAAILDKG